MNRKAKIKAGLFFGVAMAIFSIVRSLMTHDGDLTAKMVIGFVLFGLISGAIEGFLFGWLMGLFVNSKTIKQATKIILKEGETVLFETGANHFKGAEGVGGRLYLTDKRLVFKSHKFNIQNHELSIDRDNIRQVSRYKTLGIVNNGLSITTLENKVEKFVVQEPEKWFAELTSLSLMQPSL